MRFLQAKCEPILTTSVCLPEWAGDVSLEPKYARLVNAIVEHNPCAQYSVILHGSALWGDRTNLRNGFPVSDVDVLVVGETLSDLSSAASALRVIATQYGNSTVPLFKLSVKFRTVSEIVTEEISVNELGALMHGRVLKGDSRFELFLPDRRWFYHQANLAVSTRLVYVSEQQQEILSSNYQRVLSRYLAARLVLDIATVGLLLKGILGLSYTARVSAFLYEYLERIPPEVLQKLQTTLTGALRAKQDPEGHEFADIPNATNLLLYYSRRLGIRIPVPPNAIEFYRRSRPLDLRDRRLWRAHCKTPS